MDRETGIIDRWLRVALFWVVTITVQAQTPMLHEADSLFGVGQYNRAKSIYQKSLLQRPYLAKAPLPIYYKLAFIADNQQDYVNSLYYLSKIYRYQPRQSILNKINEIAATYNLQGYEVGNFDFVFLLFRNYASYLILFLLFIGIYAFGVLLQKTKQNEPIKSRHKWIVVIYLLGLLLLLNLPDSYQLAIINRNPTYLREAPSSASPVVGNIPTGNKVTIIGKEDIWVRIWWKGNDFYIRAVDAWTID